MAYILIVDDDEDFSNAVAKVMSGAGHEVDTCYQTENAIEMMVEKRPDLLILDVMFPENSSAGFDLVHDIRNYGKTLEGLPIIMLTAVNQKYPLGFSAKDIDGYWLPVTDFLEKPIDFDVLKNKVSALLEKSSGQE